MTDTSTICALATPSGAGAISVIRVSGPDCFSAVDAVVLFRHGTAAGAKGYSVKYGEVYEGGALLDQVLVCMFLNPESYTGEDSAEISCHASAYIAGRLLELLCDAGCRLAGPGEFTRRAYLNGKMDLAQAEAVADVIAASSQAAHRVAMNQLRGQYSSELRSLRSSLVELSALMELELDFSEEEVEFADRSRLMALLDEACGRISRLAASFRAGNALRDGVPVAIVGDVNAGKSTLLNALVGDDRAIVSDIAGTTRDTVEDTVVMDGVLFRFVDTAGIRETSDVIERKGVARSLAALSRAEVVVVVIDGLSGPDAVLSQVAAYKARLSDGQNAVFAVNKADLGGFYLGASGPGGKVSEGGADGADLGILRPGGKVSEGGASGAGPEGLCSRAGEMGTEGRMVIMNISAKTGIGLDALKRQIVRFSPTSTEGTVVTSRRHYEALRSALADLQRTRAALLSGLPTDLVTEDLRAAISSLGDILGEGITPGEVLGEIFGRFCIGK